MRYADVLKVIATSGDPAGVTFEGDAGSIHVTRSSIKATPSKLLDDLVTDSDVRLYQSDNHMGNFLQCARSGKAPICPVEVGHQANVVCVMVHIAMKLGRKLRWDPQQEKFLGDDAANEMLDYPHRQPWVV